MKPRTLPSGVQIAFCRDLWQECLDDCLGDEVEAKKQHDKIIWAMERQQQKDEENKLMIRQRSNQQNSPSKRRRMADHELNELGCDESAVSNESDESDSQSSATGSDSDSESDTELEGTSEEQANRSKPQQQQQQQRSRSQLLWSKPGALSYRVGVSQSVLRNWADTGVVQTMVSAGGHRLFNVKSVEQYIAKAAKSRSSIVQNRLRVDQRQVLVYVRLNANRSKAQLQAAADQIQVRVINQLKDRCTEDELQSCNIIVELEADADRTNHTTNGFSDTPGVRQLLQAICTRRRCLVVLQAIEDITTIPSTYTLLLMLCQSMGSSVEIAPGLCASAV